MKFLQYLSQPRDLPPLLESLTSAQKLPGFKKWDYDCTFECEFPKKALPPLKADTAGLLPFQVVLEGRTEASKGAPRDVFFNAARNSHLLGEHGVFFFGVHFERRDKVQRMRCPSSILLACNQGKNKIDFIYQGSEDEGIADIALEAKEIIVKSGLGTEQGIATTWDSTRCQLASLSDESVDLLFRLLEQLGSGKVFEYYWDASIMGVGVATVNAHAFELYDRAARSGLSADEIKVTFRFQILDLMGLEAVRELCEGDTTYTIPLGTFRHRNKKRATYGVSITETAFRPALQFREPPTEAEFTEIESTLGMTFARTPYPPA